MDIQFFKFLTGGQSDRRMDGLPGCDDHDSTPGHYPSIQRESKVKTGLRDKSTSFIICCCSFRFILPCSWVSCHVVDCPVWPWPVSVHRSRLPRTGRAVKLVLPPTLRCRRLSRPRGRASCQSSGWDCPAACPERTSSSLQWACHNDKVMP